MKSAFLIVAFLTASALAQVPVYEDYWYVYSDGTRIDLPIGHAAPLVTDWDEDGDKDLFIGRFSGGNIMVFSNEGTNDSPILAYTGLLEANGSPITLPYG